MCGKSCRHVRDNPGLVVVHGATNDMAFTFSARFLWRMQEWIQMCIEAWGSGLYYMYFLELAVGLSLVFFLICFYWFQSTKKTSSFSSIENESWAVLLLQHGCTTVSVLFLKLCSFHLSMCVAVSLECNELIWVEDFAFVVHMSNIYIVMFTQPASHLAWQNVDVEHYNYMQTFQPNLFIPANLTGTIDI